MLMEDRNDFSDDSTISETINTGNGKSVTQYNTSILTSIDNIEYPTTNIIYEYLDELQSQCIKYTFTDLEFSRYNMRPDLFCYDKYEDQDLAWIILALNDIISPKDFTKKTILMLDPDDIMDIISDVINAEEVLISTNRSMNTTY